MYVYDTDQCLNLLIQQTYLNFQTQGRVSRTTEQFLISDFSI